jgi:hypothetical protein
MRMIRNPLRGKVSSEVEKGNLFLEVETVVNRWTRRVDWDFRKEAIKTYQISPFNSPSFFLSAHI